MNRPTAMTTDTDEPMTDACPFTPYAELFEDVRVAPEEADRFAAVRDQIRTWVENERCYHVAVGRGTVSHPRAFRARLHTTNDTVWVTRLLPSQEQYDRRLGVDDPIVAVLATVQTGSRRPVRCYLFRRALDR